MEAACSCTDCESACSAANLNVDEAESLLEMNVNHLPVAMAVIFVVGTCIFLATVFVSNVMSNGHLPKSKRLAELFSRGLVDVIINFFL